MRAKSRKVIFAVLVVYVMLTLTGCSNDSTIHSRWDEHTIYLLSNGLCKVVVNAQIGNGIESDTIAIPVNLSGDSIRTIKVSDLTLGQFYGDDATFLEVNVSEPYTDPILIVVEFITVAFVAIIGFFVVKGIIAFCD